MQLLLQTIGEDREQGGSWCNGPAAGGKWVGASSLKVEKRLQVLNSQLNRYRVTRTGSAQALKRYALSMPEKPKPNRFAASKKLSNEKLYLTGETLVAAIFLFVEFQCIGRYLEIVSRRTKT